jgi:sRNA-binding regulator protein Hfq
MLEGSLPKSKAPAQTFEEAYYLKKLVEAGTPIRVNLVTGEKYEGLLEYWDAGFIRLTREDGPNLFIYKEQIRYIEELAEEEDE